MENGPINGHSFTQPHYTVLQNSTLVAPYIEQHMDIVRSSHPEQSDSFVSQLHMETFGSWYQTLLMNDKDVGDQLYLLAKTPSSTILTFKGYEINGNTFYTIAQDKKCTNQNSGVRFDATNNNGKKDTH